MNKDFYTEEFFNLKYLKSSPEIISYFKLYEQNINKFPHPNGKWPYLVRFIEQLIDLRNDTIWISNPVLIDQFTQKGCRTYTVSKPTIYHGFNSKQLGLDDVDDIRKIEAGEDSYFLFPEENKEMCFNLKDLPVVPNSNLHLAIFYDFETADLYSKISNEILTKNYEAVSTISKLF